MELLRILFMFFNLKSSFFNRPSIRMHLEIEGVFGLFRHIEWTIGHLFAQTNWQVALDQSSYVIISTQRSSHTNYITVLIRVI